MNHIRQFPDAGGLYDNAVRMILFRHFRERCSEISHQRTADTAAVHFANGDAGFLQEAAVDADLTEFIFNQNNLLALQRLRQQQFNQSRLAGSQKTRNNVYFNHNLSVLSFGTVIRFKRSQALRHRLPVSSAMYHAGQITSGSR